MVRIERDSAAAAVMVGVEVDGVDHLENRPEDHPEGHPEDHPEDHRQADQTTDPRSSLVG